MIVGRHLLKLMLAESFAQFRSGCTE